MKKLTILLAVLMLAAFTATVHAEGIALTDSEMDEIAAGDWVVIVEGESVVEGIHFNNNDIDLEDESQMNVQAVSNANVVDSAVAVQTNIGVATEGLVDVNGSNTADVANYNPSDEFNMTKKKTDVTIKKFDLNKTKSTTLAITKSSGSTSNSNSSSSSSSGSGAAYSDTSLTTLDITAVAALVGETESKDGETEIAAAAAFNLDYDDQKNIVKSKSSSSSSSSSSASSSSSNSAFDLDLQKSSSFDIDKKEITIAKKEMTIKKRSNKSENNHIDLEDTSQKLIQVVSNLNAVGSAAAIQTNIATAAGISGTITHANVATVVNGL